MPLITTGAQLAPAGVLETRRVLADLSPSEIGALDPTLGEWAARPFGREALATAVLPTLGSTFICLMNIEPAGLIAIKRMNIGARIHLLAVVPDMRRRGLSRSMLLLAVDHATNSGLRWLWMDVPSDSTTAVKTALACGFKRYAPQFLRREARGQLTLGAGNVHLEPAALKSIDPWMRTEAKLGDAWASELVDAEMAPLLVPTHGEAFECSVGSRTIGMAILKIDESTQRLMAHIWLERAAWGTPLELSCLKALLNRFSAQPPGLDVYFGSAGHTRLAYAAYKPHGFKPVVKPRVLMLRPQCE